MQKTRSFKPNLKRYWWLYTILVGGAVIAATMTTIITGLYRVERKSLLAEYATIQQASKDSTGLKAQRLYAEFFRETKQRQFQEENTHLAAFLGARAQFESGRHELSYLLNTNDPRAESFSLALARMETAATNPLLYLDLSNSDDFDEETASRAADLLELPVLRKKAVAVELMQSSLDVAHTLATLGDPLGAWRYWKVLGSAQSYRDKSGNVVLEIPSLLQQVEVARDAVINELAGWKQLPEDGSHAETYEGLWSSFRVLNELWLKEVSGASLTITAATDYYNEHEPQLMARETELRADIGALKSGASDEATERRRLAKYYAKGDALDKAMSASLNERIQKLTERQERLRNEVTRYRDAFSALQAFLPGLESGISPPSKMHVEKIRALLAEPGAIRSAFLPADLSNEQNWLNDSTSALIGIIRTNSYLALAVGHKNSGDSDTGRKVLALMTSHFQDIARLMSFSPETLPTDGMLSTGGSIEFQLLEEAILVAQRLSSEAPTASQQELAQAELETLTYLNSLLQRGSLMLADTQTYSVESSLSKLIGNNRPPVAAVDIDGQSLLEIAEREYQTKFTESDMLLRRYVDAKDLRVREDSRMALLTLLINDMKYHFEYLPSLDPKSLSHFKRENETPEAAQSRLRAGPPDSMRRRAAELASAIHDKATFSDRPDLWFSVRIRQGQLVAFSPGPARQYFEAAFAGAFSKAVKDKWLPLMESGELSGAGISAARDNPWVTIKEFDAAYQQRLQLALSTVPDTFVSEQAEHLPELETVNGLIAFVGDVNTHVKLMLRLQVLDQTIADTPERASIFLRQMGNLHLIQQELLLNDWRVEDAATAAEQARNYFRLSAQISSNWATENEKIADTDIWLSTGNDYMLARDYLFAIASYKRYFHERESFDLRKAKVEVYRVAEATGRAFEAVGAYGNDTDAQSSNSDSLTSAISAYKWAINAGKEDLLRTGQLPLPVFDSFIGLARSQYHLGLRTGKISHFENALKGLNEHVLHGDIFASPPANLDQTNTWRDAQYYRGLCALEIARAERSKPKKDAELFRDNIKLAVLSFDDVVQRFPDDRDATHLRALLHLARAEWMGAAFDRDSLAESGISPLKRASNRLKGLLLELDDKRRKAQLHEFRFRHLDLLHESLLLRGDVLELLARRVQRRYEALPDIMDPIEARAYLKEADDILARFDRDFPHSHEVAWALSQRISVLKQLGLAAKADKDRADGLLASALTVLDRIPDDSWAKAPAGMGKAYWTEYFKWLQKRS